MTEFRHTELHVLITGQDVYRWLGRATEVLRRHVAEINQINVFPVADGDTGFNMLGTMEAALGEIEGTASGHLGKILDLAAAGAVKGARGNSGTILSQILVGLSQYAQDKRAWTLEEYRQAWKNAYEVAYSSVSQPVEGTILTVARAIALYATGDDRDTVIRNITEAAKTAVMDTPKLLPALQSRGVVDAGAEGLYLIVAALSESTLEVAKDMVGEWRQVPRNVGPATIPYPYDVEALLAPWAFELSTEILRQKLGDWGDSVVISEMGASLKIHVHTNEALGLTRFLFELGPVVQMEIRDMRHQERETMTERRFMKIDAAWLSLLPIDVELIYPARGDQLEEFVFWVGVDAPVGIPSIDSPFLACQLMMDYDDDKSWESNVTDMVQASHTAITLTISRDQYRYRVQDLSLVSRNQVVAAVKELIGRRRMVTMYISRAEWDGEADWWQAQLDAEVVDAPSVLQPNHIEIVAQ